MIKKFLIFHKSVVILGMISLIGIVSYIISFGRPLLNPLWDKNLVNNYLDIMFSVSVSIFISIIIFVLTSFLPIYSETMRNLKSHLGIIKEIRGLLYLILEPLARKYNISSESSMNVYINESSLYNLGQLRNELLDYNSIMNLEIDRFIMKDVNPMKFYDSIDKTLRNVDYMKLLIDKLNEKIDMFHIYCNRSLYYQELSSIIMDINENYFLRTINPNSMVENSIRSENLSDLIDKILILNGIIRKINKDVNK